MWFFNISIHIGRRRCHHRHSLRLLFLFPVLARNPVSFVFAHALNAKEKKQKKESFIKWVMHWDLHHLRSSPWRIDYSDWRWFGARLVLFFIRILPNEMVRTAFIRIVIIVSCAHFISYSFVYIFHRSSLSTNAKNEKKKTQSFWYYFFVFLLWLFDCARSHIQARPHSHERTFHDLTTWLTDYLWVISAAAAAVAATTAAAAVEATAR